MAEPKRKKKIPLHHTSMALIEEQRDSPGSLENLVGSWKTKLSNETLWHLSGFWMLCTFNHIRAPQHHVCSLHVACLEEQPPSPWISLPLPSFQMTYLQTGTKLTCVVCMYTKSSESRFDPTFLNYIKTIHQEPIGSYILPETSGHDSDNSADLSHPPPRTRPRHPSRSQTSGTVCGGTWQCPAQHKHVQSGIRVRWRRSVPPELGRACEPIVRISFYQDTRGLETEICVLSRIYLCNPSLTHCQTGQDGWCYTQGNIRRTAQEASVHYRFA